MRNETLIFLEIIRLVFKSFILMRCSCGLIDKVMDRVLYCHLPHHNDTINKQTQEDFFIKIFTSHFIARVRKGYSRFACERELETEHKL